MATDKVLDLEVFDVDSTGKCTADGGFVGDVVYKNITADGNPTLDVDVDNGTVEIGGVLTTFNASDTVFQTGRISMNLSALPTSDPNNVGQLWNSAGTVKVSAG